MKPLNEKIIDRFAHPELDALRTIAFVMIFFYGALPNGVPYYRELHFGALSAKIFSASIYSLAFGVSIFFFLGAFLSAKGALIEKETTGTFHIRAFYARRMLRIIPLFALAFVVDVFMGMIIGRHRYDELAIALWNIFVGVQLYCVFPLVMRFCNVLALRYVSFACMLGSLTTLAVQGEMHLDLSRVVFANPLSQLFFFGTGLFVATLPLERISLDPLRRVLTGTYACILFPASCLLFGANGPGNAMSGTSLASGYALAGVGCLSLFLSLWGARFAIPTWLLRSGQISYGLYVYQALIIGTVWHLVALPRPWANLIALPFVAGVAELSYRYYEMPFLKLKRRYAQVQARKS
jgi:peptidoglycan/LPS O-acetylase OafA/YrhL